MKLAMRFLFVSSGVSAQFMPEQVSMIMSDAKLQLNRAQRHQAKVVERTRESVEKRIRDEAGAMTEEFAKYVAEQHLAELVLETAVNSTEGVLKAEQAKLRPGTWDPKASMDRAHLSADVGSAKKVLLHEQHQHQQALRKAEHAAEDIIGGEVGKLGMKLGDLGPLAKEIDEQLEEHIRSATQQVLKDNQTFTSPQADYNPTRPIHVSEVNQDLGNAETVSATREATADKRLNDFLARVSTKIATMSDKALSDLSHRQKEEINKVFGHAAAVGTPVGKVAKKAAVHFDEPAQASTKRPERK